MTKTFKCASCAAPLEFEGEMTQKCGFCGSTVIAPSEMFRGSRAVDPSSLTGRARKIAEIRSLIVQGRKMEAIKEFREAFGVGLNEAKDAVDAIERGEGLDISGVQVRSVHLHSGPETAAAVKKAGMAVGGSVLAGIAAFIVVVLGFVAAVIVFTLTVDRAEVSAQPDSKPVEAPRGLKNSRSAGGENDGLTEELFRIGGEGTGAGKFTDNRHVAVDAEGRIYSADYTGGRMQVFDAAGKFLTQWTVPGEPYVYDLAADRKNRLYFAGSKGIMLFEGETGKLLARTPGNADPRAMALTLDGRVITAEGKWIVEYDSELKRLNEFKKASEDASSTFGFSELAVDGNGVIYAVDRTARDICKFSRDGKFLNRIPTGSRHPNDIAIDPKGRIFLSETSNIKVIDTEGKELHNLKARQAFEMAFNDAGELFVASRPEVLRLKLNF